MGRDIKIFILIGYGLVSSIFGYAQAMDSLQHLLNESKHDTTKLKVLLELSNQCEDPDILKYALPTLELADKMLAEGSDPALKKLINSCRAGAFNNIGFYYNNQGAISQALSYWDQSIGLYEELGEKEGISVTLNNIGTILSAQGEFAKAIDYLTKSLKIEKEIGSELGMATALNNIGFAYDEQGKYDKALECYIQSLKIRKELNDKPGLATSYNNIAGIYGKRDKPDLALLYYNTSLNLYRELGSKQGIARALNNIGGVYYKQKNYSLALAFCDSSLIMSEELGFPENIKSAEEILSKIYYETKKFPQAFAHYKRYILHRDSINNEQTRRASYKSQLKYDFEKKELMLKEKQEKNRLLNEEKSRLELAIIWAVIGGMILVIIFSIFIFRSLQRNTRINKIIEEKQMEIMDSIHYAKKIQKALMPNEKYFDKELKRLKMRGLK